MIALQSVSLIRKILLSGDGGKNKSKNKNSYLLSAPVLNTSEIHPDSQLNVLSPSFGSGAWFWRSWGSQRGLVIRRSATCISRVFQGQCTWRGISGRRAEVSAPRWVSSGQQADHTRPSTAARLPIRACLGGTPVIPRRHPQTLPYASAPQRPRRLHHALESQGSHFSHRPRYTHSFFPPSSGPRGLIIRFKLTVATHSGHSETEPAFLIPSCKA